MSTYLGVIQPQTVNFWKRHEKIARLASLIQAAAVLVSVGHPIAKAVEYALEIEHQVIGQTTLPPKDTEGLNPKGPRYF